MFLSVILVPLMRKFPSRETSAELLSQTGTRFRWVGWISLFVLMATGLFQFEYRGYSLAAILNGADLFSRILFRKLILFLGILVLSALHDFWVGPKAQASRKSEPDSRGSKRLRALASWIGRGNLVLALLVIALAVRLLRG